MYNLINKNNQPVDTYAIDVVTKKETLHFLIVKLLRFYEKYDTAAI